MLAIESYTAQSTREEDKFYSRKMLKKKEKGGDRLGNSMLHKDDVVEWLRSTFCIDPTGRRSIPKHVVYQEYSTYSHNNGWAVGSAATCGRMVHRAFPSVVCSRKGGRGNAIYHYKNLCRRTEVDLKDEKVEQTVEEESGVVSSSPFSTQFSHPVSTQVATQLPSNGSSSEFGVQMPSQQPQLRWVDQVFDSFDYYATSTTSPSSDSDELYPSYLSELLSLDQSASSSEEESCSDSESESENSASTQSLEMALEGYYRNILNSLTPSTENPLEKAKPFIHHFWNSVLPSFLQYRSIDDFFYLEQRELLLLIEYVTSNPYGMGVEDLFEFLCSIACQLPLFVQSESMQCLNRECLLQEMHLCTLFSQRLYNQATSILHTTLQTKN